jgi:putative ABC transport system substrate-binding protein
VIIIAGMHGTRAVQQATQTIPIVAMSEDMLADGLVDSLSRPGRNTTGISLLSPDLDGKRQDLLIELAPRARHIAALFDSNITLLSHTQKLQAATKAQGIALSMFGAATAAEIAPAIDAAKAAGAEAINFLATPLYSINSRIVFERITALRLPAMHQWPDMAEDGALAGYGP